MSTGDNPLKDFHNAVSERLRAPLVFSYIFSFLFYHFDAIAFFVMSGHLDILARLDMFKEMLGVDTSFWGNLCDVFYPPIWGALFFTVIVPLLNVGISYLKAHLKNFEGFVLSYVGVKYVSQSEHDNLVKRFSKYQDDIYEIRKKADDFQQRESEALEQLRVGNEKLVSAQEQLINKDSKHSELLEQVSQLQNEIATFAKISSNDFKSFYANIIDLEDDLVSLYKDLKAVNLMFKNKEDEVSSLESYDVDALEYHQRKTSITSLVSDIIDSVGHLKAIKDFIPNEERYVKTKHSIEEIRKMLNEPD